MDLKSWEAGIGGSGSVTWHIGYSPSSQKPGQSALIAGAGTASSRPLAAGLDTLVGIGVFHGNTLTLSQQPTESQNLPFGDT